MDRADEYDRQAAKAEAMAERARDPAIRRQFHDIAVQWRELAAIARRGRAREPPEGGGEPEG
ncbi:MAG: hypothetical protein ACREEW_12800 [Caulobacteraceae bacterium]